MKNQTDETAKTIPGTRICHHFEPISTNGIRGKKFSCDNSIIIDHLFVKNAAQILPEVNVLPNDYATCIFYDEWWVVLIEAINFEEQDATCNFMHPTGKADYYYWPETLDRAYAPLNKFITVLDAPMSSSNGRKYIFEKKLIEYSCEVFQNYQKC